MSGFYILQEDGASKLLLEDASGALLREEDVVVVPFIASATVVYAPTVQGPVEVPFIASATTVYSLQVATGVVYLGKGTTNTYSGSASTAATLDMPAGVEAGDLLVCAVAYALNAVPSISGWTLLDSDGESNLEHVAYLYKIAGGSEPSSVSLTFSVGTTAFVAAILSFRYQSTLTAFRSPDNSPSLETGTSGAPTAIDAGTGDLGLLLVADFDGNTFTQASMATVWSGGAGGTSDLKGSALFIEEDVSVGSWQRTVTSSAGGNWFIYPLLIRATGSTLGPLDFIGSNTSLFTPTLSAGGVSVVVPFIASTTSVYGVFSLYSDFTGIGPGNGGELFPILLNTAGSTDTATLAATISSTATLLRLTGDTGFPTTDAFVATIDSEVLYLYPFGSGAYRIRSRGMSNTTPAGHTSGASVTWGDSYDMAIVAADTIAASFTADIESSGSTTYPGWLICFDSTQAYDGGSRYPMHVTELVGVFDAGAGTTGTNRLDAAQPNAIATTAAVSDDCPAALSNPARITSTVTIGDVAVVRYTNPEAATLSLKSRSVALQSWFGMKRVDDTDNDVTTTDTTGHVVDTNPGVGDYTGSVNGEWTPPVSGPGISPSTGGPTTTNVPYTSVTLPGTDRYFTNPDIGYSEKGWPICCLAVRQGKERIPAWASWDWHDYGYVYSGFGVDATFCQLTVNRNGIVFASVPEVDLPGTQDIDGPDAVWDDGTYYFAASWYVAIWQGPYLVVGPSIGGAAGSDVQPGPVPVVDFTLGAGSPTVTVPTPEVEGGSGGGISAPTSTGLHVWQRL